MVELRSDEASQSGPVRPATATSAVGVIRVLLTVLRSLPAVSGHSQSRSACLKGAKLRNTQHEQMSSALAPRTDVGLARPKTLRGSNAMGFRSRRCSLALILLQRR